MKDLRAEIGHDFQKYVDDFFKSLVKLTPVDTGRAKRGWVKKYNNQTCGVYQTLYRQKRHANKSNEHVCHRFISQTETH